MLRVVIYLVLVGLLAVVAVWFADRPGEVLITWQNRRIETSVLVLVAAVTALAVFVAWFWSALRALLRLPGNVRQYLQNRRSTRGFHAVTQGLVAIGSGDARAAQKFADEAKRLAPAEPLTLLLGAQAAQLSGDRETAERTFQSMAGREDTRLLGLHGLFIEAQRRDDPVAARLYAEEAAKSASVPAWAGYAVMEFRCAAGDWGGALDRLDRNMKGGLVDPVSYRRQRAVLLTARAIAAEESDRDGAMVLAVEAVKFAPTLVPAAALAGRLVGATGDLRRAARIVETAWKVNPHPDLAEIYAHLQPGDSARDRLARVQALAEMAPGHVEAALAVARAALDAREFPTARKALAPLLIAPTQRVAMLMAELEELEHADEGRAREWMTRAVHAHRDPAWTADGFVSDRWLPVSPVTGRLDAFQWKDPLAELEPHGRLESKARMLLHGPEAAPDSRASAAAHDPLTAHPHPASHQPQSLYPQPAAQPPARTAAALAAATPLHFQPAHGVAALPDEGLGVTTMSPVVAPIPLRRRAAGPDQGRPFEKVIPLMHMPDDPGPEPEPPTEPETEPPAEAPPDGWSKLRSLFK